MAIFKKKIFNKCTILGNDTLQRKDLSLAAKGLLSYMLSLPEDWDFSIAGLSSTTGESTYQIGKLLKELEEKGYHTKIQLHENGKIKDWIYYIFAESQQEIINKTFKGILKIQDIEIQDVENDSLNKSISNKLDIENNETKEIYNIVEKNEEIILNKNIKCIIDYLNESINSKYRYNNKTTIKLIKARFKEGYNLDDFYDVINKKVKDWFNTEMQKYLRPETLFGNKFENYLNQKAFTGKLKSSYSSKPKFDNTSEHTILKGIAQMNEQEKAKFIQNDLAKDENGNFLKF